MSSVAPPRSSCSSSYSPKSRDFKPLPPNLNSPTYYFNPEVPDSQGLGVDGRRAGQESGWADFIPSPSKSTAAAAVAVGPVTATPLSPINSLRPALALTRSHSADIINPSLPNHPIKHDAIPNSWAYLAPQAQVGQNRNPSSSSSSAKPKPKAKAKGESNRHIKKLKSWLGFNDDQEILNHMDVTLDEIVRGKTCSPLSLNDLRTYLRHQRASAFNSSFAVDLSLMGGESTTSSSSKKSLVTPPPSASLCSNLTRSMSLNDPHPEMCERYHRGNNSIDQEKTLIPISESTVENHVSPTDPVKRRKDTSANDGVPVNGDELDALQFLASYERYRRRFSNLTKSDKNRCPRVQSIGEVGLGSFNSKAESMSAMSNSNSNSISNSNSNGIDGEASSTSLPLRRDLDRILTHYLMPSRSSKSNGHPNVNRETSKKPVRRLQWLIDLGLLSEDLIASCLSKSEQTTHPSILEPIYDVVYFHLSIHVLPNFLLASTSNLSKTTRKGRLIVGIVSLFLAILFTVLLLLKPSPLSTDHESNVKRWYRILTLPLWSAGFGYCIAARTGVCVWLTLRGNHEPEEKESRWDNHSVDLERENQSQKTPVPVGKDDDDDDDDDSNLSGCKPCRKTSGKNTCWDNEDEKEEMEDGSFIRDPSHPKFRFGPKHSDSNDSSCQNDLNVEEEKVEQEMDLAPRQGSEAWLAPELLSLLSKFHLAPKFLYGSGPNQCGSNASCSPLNTAENQNQKGFSTLSPNSSSSSQNKSSRPILTPLPLAHSSNFSNVIKTHQAQLSNSSSIVSKTSDSISPSKSTSNRILNPSTSIANANAASDSHLKRPSTVGNLHAEDDGAQKTRKEPKFGSRSWSSLKKYTGFADKTEKVKESKVRRIQQIIAIRALVSCMVYSVLATIIITAVP